MRAAEDDGYGLVGHAAPSAHQVDRVEDGDLVDVDVGVGVNQDQAPDEGGPIDEYVLGGPADRLGQPVDWWQGHGRARPLAEELDDVETVAAAFCVL